MQHIGLTCFALRYSHRVGAPIKGPPIGAKDAQMAKYLEDLQKVGKEQLESAITSHSCFVKSLQAIATEANEFSKKSLESGSAFVEKLLSAKSLDGAIQIQSEYIKASYEALVEQTTKIGNLWSNLFKEAVKPIEAGITRVQSYKE